MDKKKLFLWMLPAAALFLTGCGYAGPEKAVRQEMDLIQKLDETAIKSLISYEDIRLSNSAPLEIGDETTEAVKLFFKNFKYKIRSSSVSDDKTTATVELDITNLDAEELAKDLCCAMIKDSVIQAGSSQPEGLASSFALMKDCLENNTYDLVTTSATVSLTYTDDSWVIQESPELEDALVGGLVSYLRDPYLLSPTEVLECTLEPFAGFSAEEWKNYLELDDVFSTGSSLASRMDEIVAEQIAQFFSFDIGSVTEDNDTASASVTITSLDLPEIISQCRTSLLEYAQTTESIRATDEEISQKAAEYLLAALESNTSSTESTITIPLINNGHAWEVLLDETFSDALLGGMDVALENLYADAGVAESGAETENGTETDAMQ